MTNLNKSTFFSHPSSDLWTATLPLASPPTPLETLDTPRDLRKISGMELSDFNLVREDEDPLAVFSSDNLNPHLNDQSMDRTKEPLIPLSKSQG